MIEEVPDGPESPRRDPSPGRRSASVSSVTPVRRWKDHALDVALGGRDSVFLKEELFQRTGSFKPRGALTVMLDLAPEALARGVTAVSAGNHAMAVAYAARVPGHDRQGGHAQKPPAPSGSRAVAMLGAEVELGDDVHQRLRAGEARSSAQEGRAFVHPFEGPLDRPRHRDPRARADVAGAGPRRGDRSRLAAAASRPGSRPRSSSCRPRTLVFGVEPAGADTMHRSFDAGSPQAIDRCETIADSLGAPHAAPYSFGLCRSYVDEWSWWTTTSFDRAMRLLFAIGEAGGGAGRRRRHRGPVRPAARTAPGRAWA